MKSGTTALFHILIQHPQVYGKHKEPHFFSYEGESVVPSPNIITSLESYQGLFKDVTNEIAIGEASPSYLVHPKAATNIKYYIPDAKLIAILRNPVERAYSQYWHQFTAKKESCPNFIEAFRKDDINFSQKKNFWWRSYKYQGLYIQHLNRYLRLFNRKQLGIYLYDDFKSNPQKLMREIFQFLGVDESFTPIIKHGSAKTGKPKSKLLYNLMKKPNVLVRGIRPMIPSNFRRSLKLYIQNNNIVKQPLSPEIYKSIIPFFEEDIQKLEDLLQRDLSNWLCYG